MSEETEPAAAVQTETQTNAIMSFAVLGSPMRTTAVNAAEVLRVKKAIRATKVKKVIRATKATPESRVLPEPVNVDQEESF